MPMVADRPADQGTGGRGGDPGRAGDPAAAGIPVPDLRFHHALGCFKLAVIAEGIHGRHLAGLTVGAGFGAVGEAVVPLLCRGLGLLAE
jgi:hypothetical protein